MFNKFTKEKRITISKTKIGKAKKTTKITKSAHTFRKRYCRLCVNKVEKIDYKDKVLEKFISERGKMMSRRFTGNCAKHQRLVSEAIKRARFIALLPYTKL